MPKDPLQEAAESLAKATPDYAGKSAYPPFLWWREGDQLVILCADGRKVKGPLPAASPKAALQAPGQSQKSKPVIELTQAEADKISPATHKAGK